jgi:RND family efflux transporter MFP subunit
MKKILTPVLILAVAGGSAAAMIWQKKQPEKQEITETAVIVETLPLTSHDVTFTISSQGSVTPHTETTLVSEISGMVTEVSPVFVAGGFFRQGEILLQLEPSDYDVAVQQARANLLSMQARLTQEQAQADQAKKEWDMSGRDRSQAPVLALRTPYLEEARANVLFAEADLKKAQRKLELTRIRAPYDGMIREKLVDIGQYVTTGTQLAHTFAIDFAEIRLPLTNQDIAYLDLPGPAGIAGPVNNPGPEVILSNSIGDKTYKWTARIVRTEGVIDQRTRVHYAVARIADPYGINNGDERPPLAVGSFVKASIKGKVMKDVIAVPLQAIRGMDELMIMDEDKRLRLHHVTILRTDEQYAYIRDKTLKDRQVIITAVYNPIDGMKVRFAQES